VTTVDYFMRTVARMSPPLPLRVFGKLMVGSLALLRAAAI
jgi:hypothetical protein